MPHGMDALIVLVIAFLLLLLIEKIISLFSLSVLAVRVIYLLVGVCYLVWLWHFLAVGTLF